MNKMLRDIITIITVICLMCLTFSTTLWGLKEYKKMMGFSSPTSEVGVDSSAPTFFMSTLELQRELNRRDPTLKLKEDGVCGKATQAAWDAAVNTQYALETWPEVK